MVVGLALMVIATQSPDSVMARARAAVNRLADTGAARRAGFGPLAIGKVADLTPFQGQHWLHRWRVFGGSPGLLDPSFIMYVPIGGQWRPAGLAYSRRIGPDSMVPTELGGTRAPWHLHQPCAVVPGEGDALADGAADCRARGGLPRPPEIAMVHAWTGIPNPEGPFAHDNVALPYWVTGLEPPTVADFRDPKRVRRARALGLALGESYGALLPYARLIEFIGIGPQLADSLETHRATLRRLVAELVRAERGRDRRGWSRLVDQAIAEEAALGALYRKAAPSQAIAEQLDRERRENLGERSPEHHH